jgi:hypothetical protein
MVGRATILLAAALLGAAAVAAASARAAPLTASDSVAVPPGSPDPWSDPSHHTPLEQLASTIASSIVGRPVAAKCEDQASWDGLNVNGDSGKVLGFVNEPAHSTTTPILKYRYVWASKRVHGKRVRYRRKVAYTTLVTHADTFTTSATTIELSPQVCGPLQQFAEASPKPTKCAPNGALVPCFVGAPTDGFPAVCTDSSETTCYSTASDWSEDYFTQYDAYAQAVITLAHESIHVSQGTKGNVVPADTLVEAQAECSGMQWTARVAVQLGDTPDDAEALADYIWLLTYPGERDPTDAYSTQHPYWSADCTPGGPLDVRPPGATAWP